MGKEIYQPEPILEQQYTESVIECFLPSPERKSKVVLSLNRERVDVRAQVVRREDSEYCRIGDPSYREGEESVEVTVIDKVTQLRWKVVDRGIWILKHRVDFERTQPGK